MDKEYRVALFVSRHKDNEGIDGFKVRSRSVFTNKTVSELEGLFQEFINRGCPGEVSRFYISVNTRDYDKVYKALQVELVLGQVDLTKIETRVAALAMKPSSKLSKKFLFDCDVELGQLGEAVEYLIKNKIGYTVVPTKNFNALVTDGFDYREFEKLFPFLEFKKDGELYVTSGVKE